MYLRPVILVAFFLCLCCPCGAKAQENVYPDEEDERYLVRRLVDYLGTPVTDRTLDRPIDFSFIAGPSYSDKTSLSIGVMAAGLFRTDRTDPELHPSNITLFGNVSINGYYYVGISGNTFFARNRHRLDYELGFRSQPTLFWGTGYEAAMRNPAGSYTAKRIEADIQYKYALAGNIYAGAALSFSHIYASNLTVVQYLGGQSRGSTAAGAGPFIEFDSRDNVTQPFRGWYASLAAIVFPQFLGDCRATLWRVRVILDRYQRLWRTATLAIDLYGEFNSARSPWTMNAQLGGNSRMRGYYEGQFNDRNMIALQVELRQQIWQRIGCVVWAGAGNVFPSLSRFDWSQTLPDAGAGLRWEFKKRMNIRIDCGVGRRVQGRLTRSVILSINEAF